MTRRQWVIATITLLTAVITIVTNVATSKLPNWIQPYLWLFWPLLFLLIALLIAVSIIGATHNTTIPQFDESKLDKYVQDVCEAEQASNIDPEKLADWEKVSNSLAKISRADKNDWEDEEIIETPALLLIRLAKIIVPAMEQYGHLEDLIKVASAAYVAGMALKNWADATRMAYYVAYTLYNLERFTETEKWEGLIEKSLNHINPKPTELLAISQEMKGLITRDYIGKLNDAKVLFEKALAFSAENGNSLMIWRVSTHLGKLEERGGHLDRATERYTNALAAVSQSESPTLKLICCNELGRLAYGQNRLDDSYMWHMKQLTLAKSSKWISYEGRAHEGLARALSKKTPPNYKEAFQHAKQALDIEKQITGPRLEALRDLLIDIACKVLLENKTIS